MSALALFDLDNTLLTGDSEVLWVDFLIRRGVLDGSFIERNADMDRRYHAGTAAPSDFCEFFASTFTGRTPDEWAPARNDFMRDAILPRIPKSAHELVQQHREQGDIPVLTSASSRFLVEPTAAALGFEHVIATELEVLSDGRFAGRTRGVLNMRDGKVTRIARWIADSIAMGDESVSDALASASFYSDSINDLPLLLAVGHPVVVDPDARLLLEAQQRRWPVLRLERSISVLSST